MTNLLLAVIYLAFISLGLPDGLLGAAWPSVYPQFQVPVAFAGYVSMIISAGTIISALLSDRLTLRFGAGKVTAASVATTALALAGFSISPNYWVMCLVAIPYGLGAGAVDAALNNYVALHYASRHMSWLHCMWGIGASVGPYIMSFALTSGYGWPTGYRWVALLQVVLTAVIIFSLPLWKNRAQEQASHQDNDDTCTVQLQETQISKQPRKALSLREIVTIPGVPSVLVMFFCYCALETTSGLWAASFMVLDKGVSSTQAAAWASLFYLGITLGRALSGFITMKFSDPTMIRMGQIVVALGIIILLLPFGRIGSLIGLIVIGFGCAPIYPCVIHSTPAYFGADKSQAIIGVQMASAYCGSLLAPAVFGWLADTITIALFPWYLAIILVLMVVMHENLRRTRSMNPILD